MSGETVGIGQRASRWLPDWITRAVVLLVPVAYVLGFLSWGVYAASYDTGYLPVSPERYLASGTMLLAVLGLALGCFVAGKRLRILRMTRYQAGLLVLLALLPAPYLASIVSELTESVSNSNLRFGFPLVLALAFTLGLVSSFFDRPGRKVIQDDFRRSSSAWLALLVGTWLLTLPLFWGYAVLPYLAQEFGGGAPQCAVLLVEWPTDEGPHRELFGHVLYRDDSSVVFVASTDETFSKAAVIAMSEVSSISWCDELDVGIGPAPKPR